MEKRTIFNSFQAFKGFYLLFYFFSPAHQISNISQAKKTKKTRRIKKQSFFSVLYSIQYNCYTIFSKQKLIPSLGKLGLSAEKSEDGVERAVLDQPSDQNESERGGQRIVDDETEYVTYSYTFFHVTMMFACLYLMMTITNWYK